MDTLPTKQKRPWHLVALLIPLGLMMYFVFLAIRSSYQKNIILHYSQDTGFLVISSLASILLTLYLVILLMVIVRRVKNKWISRASMLSWITSVIGIIGTAWLMSVLPNSSLVGVFYVALLYLLIGVCILSFAIAGFFFAIGFFERSKLVR